MLNALSIGDIAEFASAIAAFIALFLSWKSINETRKNTESATRPVIVPYISIENKTILLTIENFGSSPGTITSCTIDDKLFPFVFGNNTVASTVPLPFTYLTGTTFPPGYKVSSQMDFNTVNDFLFLQHNNSREGYNFTFSIEYTSETGKLYNNSNYPYVNFGVLSGFREYPERS